MKILIVDDIEKIRVMQETVLKARGFTVESAANGKHALEVAALFCPDMIISDILMPEMDGFELCRTVKADKKLKNIPFVFYSASYTGSKDKELATALGASRYIVKPMAMKKFVKIIEEMVKEYEDGNLTIPVIPEIGAKEMERMHGTVLVNKLSEKVEELQEEIARRKDAEELAKQSLEKLKMTVDGVIIALAKTIEQRDPYTAGHQQRVSKLACAIAGEMGMPEDQIEGVRTSGILHDIGKMNIPAEFLSKPGKLTESEYAIIKTHAHAGYEILKGIEFPWPIGDIVHQHHERMDGSGYPLGLSNGDILMEARILCAADIIEAMSTHRPYRPALGIDKALEEISRGKGVHYDSDVADACFKVIKEKGFKFEDKTL